MRYGMVARFRGPRERGGVRLNMEDRPAIILHNIRRILRDADRRGETIRPRYLLDIIEGKKA